jgi:hypothetical protein
MYIKGLVWQDSFRLLNYHSLLVCSSSSPHNLANLRYQLYALWDVEDSLVFLNLKEQKSYAISTDTTNNYIY